VPQQVQPAAELAPAQLLPVSTFYPGLYLCLCPCHGLGLCQTVYSCRFRHCELGRGVQLQVQNLADSLADSQGELSQVELAVALLEERPAEEHRTASAWADIQAAVLHMEAA